MISSTDGLAQNYEVINKPSSELIIYLLVWH